MPEASMPHDDLKHWREYCAHLGRQPPPKTSFDPLRLKIADKSAQMDGFWERTDDGGAAPFDGDCLAEVRAPIARAIAAIKRANLVKKDYTKRSHLATAIAWLESPHPWLGEATKLEIAAMIAEIEQAIINPSMSLDHLLNNSSYHKAQTTVSHQPVRPSLLDLLLRK